MTMIKPQATPEELAGVPTAAELSALANALFPDLTGDLAGEESVRYGEYLNHVVEPKAVSYAPSVLCRKAFPGFGCSFEIPLFLSIRPE